MSNRSQSGLARLFPWLQRRSEYSPLEAAEFQRLFLREKALSDRGSRTFSLILIEAAAQARAVEAGVGAEVEERLREGDVFGRFDSKRLAVLLAGTASHGAKLYADELERKLAARGLRASVTIYAERGGHSRGEETDDQAPPSERAAGGPPPSTGTHDPQPLVEAARAAVAADPEARADGAPTAEASLEPLAAIHSHPAAAAARHARAEAREVQDLEQLAFLPLPRWKRALDIVASGTALVLLSPVLAAIAVAVRLSSPGPILFCQQRAGVGGVPFPFYKFRSMVVDAEALKQELADENEKDGPIFKMKNDPRVTRVGRFIRRYSLDELPQLYNVLKGDMTLVGPRPPTMDEVEAYEPWQRQRLLIKGGLTCTWQVSGRSDVSFEDWMRMDARYARTSGFVGDVKLILKTVKAIFTGRGAY